eukprot:CAMPEP_0180242470 /NCGR_PEP_ID=MMETSP0987-20121128/33228_1 /TAXON_ID=697907 /ORGANISM="non described non described, Strain CCMP2293" /LENGTH=91 /DNA_ID=CAMNT_0022209561 /DNA_START=489 /DNA_END=764 /DNA_ORIENTATION=+
MGVSAESCAGIPSLNPERHKIIPAFSGTLVENVTVMMFSLPGRAVICPMFFTTNAGSITLSGGLNGRRESLNRGWIGMLTPNDSMYTAGDS